MFAVSGAPGSEIGLVTLYPGHFHAGLVQKSMYPQVSPIVHVYAPPGPDLQEHLQRIQGFNSRPENPTHWQEQVYSGRDFLERMAREKAGNVVVLAGNNAHKTEYIARSIEAGFNVLADKPMAITPENFALLRKAFEQAAAKRVLLYDIMTERFEITSILQRELARMPEIFGELEKGTPDHPAVIMESVHNFYKEVAGKTLIRPAWFYDARQQGEAIPDVGTHLIDAVQWECFPGQKLDWQKDIKVLSAQRWPTRLSFEQFRLSTGEARFPEYLKPDLDSDGSLKVFANGEVVYTIRGVHVKITATWDFETKSGKDSHQARLRGTRADVVIYQGPLATDTPSLFVYQKGPGSAQKFEKKLRAAVAKLAGTRPGLAVNTADSHEHAWQIIIPEKYVVGHEAHFGQVTENFLSYLARGKLPSWEVPNMLAKYYTSTEAYRLSHEAAKSK